MVLANPTNTTIASGEDIGATVVAATGGASALCVIVLLAHMLYTIFAAPDKKSGIFRPRANERIFLRETIGFYIICLMICGLVGGLAYVLELKWSSTGRIFAGSVCTAQGFLGQFSDVGAAIFQTLIALHVFNTLVLGKRLSPTFVTATITLGWIITTTLAAAGGLFVANFYRPVGFMCSISNALPVAQIFLHFIPMYASISVVLILYSVVFFYLRGNIVIAEGLNFSIRRSGNLTKNEYQQFMGMIARRMFWYPLVYIALNFPSSVVYWLALTRGKPVATSGSSFAMASSSLIGLAYVIVYAATRNLGREENSTLNAVLRVSVADEDDKASIRSFAALEKADAPKLETARPTSREWKPPSKAQLVGLDVQSKPLPIPRAGMVRPIPNKSSYTIPPRGGSFMSTPGHSRNNSNATTSTASDITVVESSGDFERLKKKDSLDIPPRTISAPENTNKPTAVTAVNKPVLLPSSTELAGKRGQPLSITVPKTFQSTGIALAPEESNASAVVTKPTRHRSIVKYTPRRPSQRSATTARTTDGAGSSSSYEPSMIKSAITPTDGIDLDDIPIAIQTGPADFDSDSASLARSDSLLSLYSSLPPTAPALRSNATDLPESVGSDGAFVAVGNVSSANVNSARGRTFSARSANAPTMPLPPLPTVQPLRTGRSLKATSGQNGKRRSRSLGGIADLKKELLHVENSQPRRGSEGNVSPQPTPKPGYI